MYLRLHRAALAQARHHALIVVTLIAVLALPRSQPVRSPQVDHGALYRRKRSVLLACPALPVLLGWPDTENTPPDRLWRQVSFR